MTPRGIRNNNPFNLKRSKNRWLGKVPFELSSDKTFEQFESMDYGVRAGMINLCSLIKRCNSLLELVAAYAPASENDVDVYYFSVCNSMRRLGCLFPDYYELVSDYFIELCLAIIWHENGRNNSFSVISLRVIFEKFSLRRYVSKAVNRHNS